MLAVGVIFGGRSGEHEVSILSARSVIGALDRERYQVVPIGITKEGHWLSPERSQEMLNQDIESSPSAKVAPTPPYGDGSLWDGVSQLFGLDVVFPALHGPYGEDGTIQGLLETVGAPYVGAGVAASAIGMDKALMKAVFVKEGLPVVPYVVIRRSEWEERPLDTIKGIEAEVLYPCFVKPASLGSSVGVSKVGSREDMGAALDEASRWDRKLLVEKAVTAREIECGLLGNEYPQASVVGEIIPAREFYDYYAKYHDNRTQLLIPASLPTEVAQRAQELALRAYKAIDCSGMARVDMFLDKNDGQVYVSEINTIPGFTSVSMYPKLWGASGVSYPALLDRLIDLALERHREWKRALTAPLLASKE
ncbi:MAG: D-alanine/D-alanine ligase [Dehalococcoidia bacterium]|nr:D-alanine/D-alanine ligase [Dehalococcoidia bacterium]